MTHLTKLPVAFLAVSLVVGCAPEVDDSQADPTVALTNAELAGLPCEASDEALDCDLEDGSGEPGVMTCESGAEGLVWSICAPEFVPPGPDECSEGYAWDGYCCADPEYSCCEGEPCNTPLVLSKQGAAVTYTRSLGEAAFDLTGVGTSLRTDWPTASTPWLALDRDGDGAITSGAELFGSATPLAEGGLAGHGFEALRELDDDHDGLVTPADASWSRLLVWTDVDASRTSSPGELRSASEAGLEGFDLAFGVDRRCDDRRNCEVQRARYWYRDHRGTISQGEVIDVHLGTH